MKQRCVEFGAVTMEPFGYAVTVVQGQQLSHLRD